MPVAPGRDRLLARGREDPGVRDRDVGFGAQATLDYSFDRLAVASGGNLFYFDGSNLTEVTDPDLGYVVDMRQAMPSS